MAYIEASACIYQDGKVIYLLPFTSSNLPKSTQNGRFIIETNII